MRSGTDTGKHRGSLVFDFLGKNCRAAEHGLVRHGGRWNVVLVSHLRYGHPLLLEVETQMGVRKIIKIFRIVET